MRASIVHTALRWILLASLVTAGFVAGIVAGGREDRNRDPVTPSAGPKIAHRLVVKDGGYWRERRDAHPSAGGNDLVRARWDIVAQNCLQHGSEKVCIWIRRCRFPAEIVNAASNGGPSEGPYCGSIQKESPH